MTGDHGEGLGDHGEATHGVLLYGSTVDVPLILWPAQPPVGEGPFGLIDVALEYHVLLVQIVLQLHAGWILLEHRQETSGVERDVPCLAKFQGT